MQVHNINSTTFQSKTRFLDKSTTFRLNDIADKMKNATRTMNRGQKFRDTSYLVNVGLKNKKVNFIYPYVPSINKDAIELCMGKTDLIVDKNGQILDYKKPFFMPWWSIIKNTKKYLTTIHENFYNKNVIEKQRIVIGSIIEDNIKKSDKNIREI